jgi:hypothetical protein
VYIPETVTIFPTQAQAQALADANNRHSDDDGWTYTATARPDGRYIVTIHDETGHRIGTL